MILDLIGTFVFAIGGAAGLGLFAVFGTHKALAYGIHPFPAALLGMLTERRRGYSP